MPHETAFISFRPPGPQQGRVLLAHIVQAFIRGTPDSLRTSHNHFAEAVAIVDALLELGYAVDVISYRNTTFHPHIRYDLFISSRVNFELIAKRLPRETIKIVHLDTAHWLHNNAAALNRCLEVRRERHVALASYKLLEPTWAIDSADYATLLGNEVTYETYRFGNTPVFQLPNPAVRLYPCPINKDLGRVRHHFIWLGSRGFIQKGLDLVLAAFARMPEYRLTVCGPISQEPDFAKAFHKELYETPNIRTHGWIDVGGHEFQQLANECIGLIYPSCAEGAAGAVVTCMQAGLIPIISRESGIDIDESLGLMLGSFMHGSVTVESLMEATRRIAGQPADALKDMAVESWRIARSTYSPENYKAVFTSIIRQIVAEHPVSTASGFVSMPTPHGSATSSSLLKTDSTGT
ncbi:glycosyltransferase involved in cell wall biosynthesis [Thiocapsa rosea]|uniref:Glycosyltransferase involved in cell wall biosynthesis n=1 Tax=Thiocapsa rosea TaxID=69360 RepID=A0A495VEY2_9GAMM|nr:glycosyltransferase involved in cell wall biosynthesis [Thiocapsa rosea]